MVTIATTREPVTVSLKGAYAQVTVTLRRLTSPHFGMARHAAQSILDDDGKLLVLLAEHDLLPKGSVKELKRLRDEDLVDYAAFMTGIRLWISAVECGLLGILSWTGIGQGGASAPVDRQTLEVLMLDESFSQQIMDELDLAARILLLEGKP